MERCEMCEMSVGWVVTFIFGFDVSKKRKLRVSAFHHSCLAVMYVENSFYF